MYSKKILLVILLTLSVVGVYAQCATPLNTFPYVEDFETGPAWTTSASACTPLGLVINDWQWGHPIKNVINSAGSGYKCWIVGDTSGWFYAYGERSWIESPCFNFSAIQYPYVQFKIWWESEYKYDGTNLQYSLDAGTTWKDVGAFGDPTDCMDANWYNYNNVTNLGSYSHSLPGHGNTSQTYPSLCTGTSTNGWCGNIQAANYADTTGVSGSTCQAGHGSAGWVTAKHCMPYLAGQPQVLFRFTFGAGTSCNNFNAIAIDSVAIGNGTPNTASFIHTCINTNTLQFTGTVTQCPDTFQWNFGDPGSGASNTILGAGSLTPTHTFSAPGTYNVTFTVKGGPCNPPASITQTVKIIGVTTTTTPAGCTGAGGSAIAVVGGNATPYTYAWSTAPVQTHDTATGLAASTYTVTVTTAGACSATASATITASTPMTHVITTTPSLCTSSNGTAKVVESGGTPGYTYVWSGGLGTTDSIKNVAAGTYTLTLTDSHGCQDVVTVTIANGGGVTASLGSQTNVTCHGQNNGSSTINTNGGTQPYTYHWTTTLSNNNNTENGLAPGSYVVTVTDANGCQATVPVTITQPTAFSPTVTTTSTLCGASTGTAKVVETGSTPNYTYLWSNGLGTADSIKNQPAGSYTLTITDSKGCLDTVPVSISNSGGVTATLGGTTNVTCPGGANGTITVNAANGTLPYTYHWTSTITNANSTQGGFAAGTYTITVTDASGCIATVSATITQPQPFANTTTTNPTTCGLNNGSAKVIETGGTPAYTYQWSGGLGTADSIINVGPGTYTLTITDNVLCTATASVTIGATPVPTAALGNTINDSCFGYSDGSITINASSGVTPYTYHWGASTTTTSTQTGFAAGSYIITVTDANNCSATVPVTITQPNPLTVVPTFTNVTCPSGSNGTVSLAVNGGNGNFVYLWSNTTQTTQNITGLTANTYNVTVTDQKGCTKDTFATIIQPPPFTITFPTVIDDSCSYSTNGSATILVSGATPGYTYLWSNTATTTTVTGLAAGTYTVTVSDTNHCTAVSSVVIAAPQPIVLTPSATPVICFNQSNGTASVVAAGGTPAYTYLWNTTATTSTITALAPGNYAVTVTDNMGCTASQSGIVVNNPPQLGVTATVTPQSCSTFTDGSVDLTASGGTPGYTYEWSPTAGNIADNTGLAAGTYQYTVTDSHGCTVNGSSIVTLQPAITLLTSLIEPLCPPLTDGSISVTPSGGTPGYSYTWSNGEQNATDLQLGPGVYALTVTDSKGCIDTISFVLSYQRSFSVEAGADDTVTLGGSATLIAVPTPAENDISYYWTPDYKLSCNTCQITTATPLQTMTYIVYATDTNGCKASDSVTVYVNVQYDLYVPSAFTPNGDGINDFFEIFGNKSAWNYVDIKIFDRWGEKVFESNDLYFQWDGTYRGQIQQPDVFVYILTVGYIDGHSTGVLKGSITLIR